MYACTCGLCVFYLRMCTLECVYACWAASLQWHVGLSVAWDVHIRMSRRSLPSPHRGQLSSSGPMRRASLPRMDGVLYSWCHLWTEDPSLWTQLNSCCTVRYVCGGGRWGRSADCQSVRTYLLQSNCYYTLHHKDHQPACCWCEPVSSTPGCMWLCLCAQCV